MEHYTAHTKYDLVWRRRPSTGERVHICRAISCVVVTDGGVDPKEDINHQSYGHTGDIYLDVINSPQAYGVQKDEIRQE